MGKRDPGSETIKYDEQEFTVSVKSSINCEYCGYNWVTKSEAKRPTCPSCANKTDRINERKATSIYTESFCNVLSADDLGGIIERYKRALKKLRALRGDGWTVAQSRGDGRYVLEKRE